MIKVQNNVATREPIPAFLVGLAPESLADLSWTDPQLGVNDCAWLPEDDRSPALGQYERYGTETLTVDGAVVAAVRAVLAWSEAEIAADKKSKVPAEVTMRQARLALFGAGLLPSVDAAIAGMTDPQKTAAQIEWGHSQTVQRSKGLVVQLGAALGLTDLQIDQLFITAATL